MTELKPWPMYKAESIIGALKIKEVSEGVAQALTPSLSVSMVTISFVEKDYPPIEVLPSFIQQFKPKAGDYIMRSNEIDGVPYVTADIFEKKWTPILPATSEDIRLPQIAHLIGSIFFYGDFKAETHNERQLQKLLEETGYFYTSEDQVLNGSDAILQLAKNNKEQSKSLPEN